MARTLNVWLPFPTRNAFGEVQEAQALASMRHWKCAAASLEEKPKVTRARRVVIRMRSLGALVIEVFGARTSTAKLRWTGDASVLPWPSVARASKM